MMKRLAVLMVLIAAVLVLAAGCAGPNYQKGLKNYKPENAAQAVMELKPLAEQGNAEAQFRLGSLYYQGLGLPQDYREAATWFRKAAEQQYVYAQVTLGTIYAEGVQGVFEKDYPQALMWFIFAGAQGDMEAIELRDVLAARMTPAQIAEAQKMAREFKPQDAYTKLYHELKTLAEKGNALAQLKIGFMYYSGKGISRDYGKAIHWFKQSAQQGNPLAQSNVGYMYKEGEGVPQDYSEAAKWYRQASERGNALAQFALGSFYEKGIGVPQDEVQSLMWFTLSAIQGNANAKAARNRVVVWMSPEQIEKAQKLAREFRILDK
jgi:uncharacterized protein